MPNNNRIIDILWMIIGIMSIVIILFGMAFYAGKSSGQKSKEEIEGYMFEREARLDEMSSKLEDINNKEDNLMKKIEELELKIEQLEELLELKEDKAEGEGNEAGEFKQEQPQQTQQGQPESVQ